MRDLRLELRDTDFEELVEIGRSLIPTLAPGWTDHNTHDPGVMLMELLAWVSDAQIYALARTRRDERRSYARLFGVQPHGPEPAHGFIWPDSAASMDPSKPLPWANGTVVDTTRAITPDQSDAPVFHLTDAIRLTTARLIRIVAISADNVRRDLTRANSQDGASFLPFGAMPEPGDRLLLEFSGSLAQGEAGNGAEAFFSIGIQLVNRAAAALTSSIESSQCARNRLQVSLISPRGEREIEVVRDTTEGLFRSGVLLLRIPAVAASAADFTIAIQSRSGEFLRVPRVQQILPNVLPVVQSEPVSEEAASFGTGMPDQEYALQHPGLQFAAGKSALKVLLGDSGQVGEWNVTDDLRDRAPDETCYVLDQERAVVRFGNGVNGKTPAPGADLQVQFPVSRGARGNLPKDLRWHVAGVAGLFGTNPEPTFGGEDGIGLADLQREARHERRNARPLITTTDLENTALSFVDLGVARALELLPDQIRGKHVRGTRVLIVIRGDDVSGERTQHEPERALWLEAVRVRLTRRLPLGQKLSVTAPRYVPLRIRAALVAQKGVKLETVIAAAEKTLRTKLALTKQDADPPWPFGRDLSLLTIKGWLRSVQGVAALSSIALEVDGVEHASLALRMEPAALPLLLLQPGDLSAVRPGGSDAS